ncbi:hypothetical protein B0H21DRAFT_449642 [Amylocystis lapponica]|nr:hypothetical protein B0H21DRAFT_449642 [Amylocystis lapponica]
MPSSPQAVLLLRPTVPLYSTDALPINCSAYSRPEEPTLSSSNTSPLTSPLRAPASPPERTLPRSCECLTQTLCCHGCGTAVGYMIVIPCTRCTSSISATNRATNGHRFVFYSSAISADDRRYVPGERGVLPDGAPTSAELFAPPEPAPPEPAEPVPERLRAGDVLFWHHLVRSGEIPAVCEDARARGSYGGGRATGTAGSAHGRCADEVGDGAAGRVAAKGGVFAGR